MKRSVCYYSLLYWLLILVVFTHSATALCEDNALGIENKTIPDGQLKSSSSFNASTSAKNARLNFVGLPWCAVASSTPLYLQVDLGSLHAVCAVATQGNSKADQWLETYQLKISTDGTNWTNYEEGGQIRDFQGNADTNTTVKQVLFEGVVTRYVRVVPKTCHGLCCLRMELYGAADASCQTSTVGIADRSKIPDHSMTATSFYDERYRPYNGRFSVEECAWEAEKKFTRKDYLQVDLGGVHFICTLATKGNGKKCSAREWTTKYKIYLSLDNKSWNTYKENGVDKEFIGNKDKINVQKNQVSRLPRAKFIRFWPIAIHNWALLRVEVYGTAQACRSSLGMELKSIKDSQITAQPNTNTPSNGRLYKTSTWCSSDKNGGYLQVDLGQVKTVTGVATQGHHSSDEWVKTYKISYNYDSSLNASWQDYKLKDSGSVMTFDGNVNKNGVRVNWFPVPVVARHIRVIADSWTPSAIGPCLRIDLYGCDHVLRPVMTLTNKVLPLAQGKFVDVFCNVTSQSQLVMQWWLGNTDVTSLSSGVIRSDDSVSGVSVSTLRVNFTSVDDIAAKYDCTRESSSSRVVACTVAFSCSAFYAGIKSETIVTRSAAVAVTLSVPAAPTSVKVNNIQSKNVTLQWSITALGSNEGSISSFIIEHHISGSSSSVTSVTAPSQSSSFQISDLLPYTAYRVRLHAVSTVGEGLWSDWVNFKTDSAKPEVAPVVENPVATSSQTIKVTWKKPTDKVNGPLEGYQISYQPDGGAKLVKTVQSTTLTVELDSLKKWTEYKIRVQVKNDKGVGPYSVEKTVKTKEDAPSFAPSDLVVDEFNDTAFNVSWRPLSTNESNGIIVAYEVTHSSAQQQRVRRGNPTVVQTNTTKESILLTNLAPCNKYSVKVKAYTSVGPGPDSVPVERTTAAPTAPRDLQVVSSETKSGEVTLKWKKPDRLADDIESYTIKWEGSKTYNKSFKDSNEKKFPASPLHGTVTGLIPGTVYKFRISAKTSTCGEGTFSNTATASTLTDVPPPLSVAKVARINTEDTAVNVMLWQASDLNGEISLYQVIVHKTGGESKRLPPDLNLGNYKYSQDNNIDYYIAVAINADSVDWSSPSVIIGDGSSVKDYENVELEKGEIYSVYERAIVSRTLGEVLEGEPELIANVVVSKVNEGVTEPSKSEPVSPVAVAVPIAFVLFLVPLLIFLVWRRRRRNHQRNERSEKKDTPYKLNPLVPEVSLEVITEDLNIEQPPEEEPACSDNKALEGVYCAPNDDGGDHQPIAVLGFSDYTNRMKQNDNVSLKGEFNSLDKGLIKRSYSIAKRPENKSRNRYANILTYNNSRVILETMYSNEENDYINASYIPGFDKNPHTYIATQGPTNKTLDDFWLMVWQQNCTSIVMLTNLVEQGKAKCSQYWPDATKDYRSMTVTLHKEEVFADYLVRTFVVKKDGVSRQVCQFHFISWPDKGVPRCPTAVLTFRRKIRSWKPANSGPVVVHCSAGVGRTGTYIVIDAMIEQAKNLKTVDIFNYTRTLRENRPYMVQTDQQYVFIHDAILEALTCGNTEVPVHDLRVTMSKLLKNSRGNNGYKQQFQRLEFVTHQNSRDDSKIGPAAENATKNRFPCIVPLDSSRVILRVGEQQGYINASFVDAFRERNAFIMTQAPLESTIEDFWLMLLQYKIGTIVMLNNLQEGNENFPQYWPSARSATYGSVIVESVSEENRDEIVIRTFKVLSSKNPRQGLTIMHHQHTCWPDKSVPANYGGLLDMMNAVQISQQRSGNAPVVVHCSDGVGRSGTFCAIYSAVERLKLDQVVDVFQSIKLLRVKRPGAVETLDQYVFCYEAIQQYLDSFSDYANFSEV